MVLSANGRLQSERDCRRFANFFNARLEGAIAAGQLEAIPPDGLAERLRSGDVLWRLLETLAPRAELVKDDKVPRGLRSPEKPKRNASRIESPGPARTSLQEVACESRGAELSRRPQSGPDRFVSQVSTT